VLDICATASWPRTGRALTALQSRSRWARKGGTVVSRTFNNLSRRPTLTSVNPDPSVSYLCDRDSHDRCPHHERSVDAHDATKAPDKEDLHAVELCRCPCHTDCPIFLQETVAEWPGLCDCPGMLAELQWRERIRERPVGNGINFGEIARQSLDTSRRRNRAKAELHRRAKDLRPEEVDAILDEVWSAERLDPPVTAVRDLLVNEALHPGSPIEKLKRSADGLEGMGRWVGGMVQFFRKLPDSADEIMATRERFYQVPTKKGAGQIEVELDPEGLEHLGATGGGPLSLKMRAFANGVVELRLGANNVIEVFEHHPGSGEHPACLGTLREDKAVPFLRSLAAAGRVAQTATVEAVRVETSDGRQRLFVGEPLSKGHE